MKARWHGGSSGEGRGTTGAKAVVLAIEGGEAILLTREGLFQRVPARAHWRVGQEVWLEPAAPRGRTMVVWAVVAFLLVMVLVGLEVAPAGAEAVGYVTLDVGPASVGLVVAETGRVLDVEVLNEAGRSLVPRPALVRGRPVDQVIPLLVRRAERQPALEPAAAVAVIAAAPLKAQEGLPASLRQALTRARQEAARPRSPQEQPLALALIAVQEPQVGAMVGQTARRQGISVAAAALWLAHQREAGASAAPVPVAQERAQVEPSLAEGWRRLGGQGGAWEQWERLREALASLERRLGDQALEVLGPGEATEAAAPSASPSRGAGGSPGQDAPARAAAGPGRSPQTDGGARGGSRGPQGSVQGPAARERPGAASAGKSAEKSGTAAANPAVVPGAAQTSSRGHGSSKPGGKSPTAARSEPGRVQGPKAVSGRSQGDDRPAASRASGGRSGDGAGEAARQSRAEGADREIDPRPRSAGPEKKPQRERSSSWLEPWAVCGASEGARGKKEQDKGDSGHRWPPALVESVRQSLGKVLCGRP